PGLEKLSTADVLLVSVRRRIPTQEDMARLKAFIAAGKPVVGIRTASHAFVLRKGTFPETHADWPNWDADIFGGNYTNHHGEGPITEVTRASTKHPVLEGIQVPFTSKATLYRVAPLKPNATALLTGKIPGEPEQPIAYIATHSGGGKAFYTSLGAPSDFEGTEFPRLLKNALIWAAKPTAKK
ncbi:MAG TPA: ThuA domain-containing protein, partial [Opitutaceae bacterium]|nr:ThuA domain-containing protein [Opitutaceae bacterium]